MFWDFFNLSGLEYIETYLPDLVRKNELNDLKYYIQGHDDALAVFRKEEHSQTETICSFQTFSVFKTTAWLLLFLPAEHKLNMQCFNKTDKMVDFFIFLS